MWSEVEKGVQDDSEVSLGWTTEWNYCYYPEHKQEMRGALLQVMGQRSSIIQLLTPSPLKGEKEHVKKTRMKYKSGQGWTSVQEPFLRQ